ncbi:MAG TPA: hypothetical protein PKI62_03395 [bacterium]|nr:hypothetical protein [bacterium]HPR89223.1 hypothetical protein [bacterium]
MKQGSFLLQEEGIAGYLVSGRAEHDLSDGDIAVKGAITVLFADETTEEPFHIVVISGIEIAHLTAGFAGDDQGLGYVGFGFRTNLLGVKESFFTSLKSSCKTGKLQRPGCKIKRDFPRSGGRKSGNEKKSLA